MTTIYRFTIINGNYAPCYHSFDEMWQTECAGKYIEMLVDCNEVRQIVEEFNNWYANLGAEVLIERFTY